MITNGLIDDKTIQTLENAKKEDTQAKLLAWSPKTYSTSGLNNGYMDATKFCVLPRSGGQAWLTQDSAINWAMLIQAVIKDSKDVSHFIPFSQVAAYRTYDDQYRLHVLEFISICYNKEYANLVSEKLVNNPKMTEREAYIA